MSNGLNNPQPIDTAPKDGTVILTDCGLVKSTNMIQLASRGEEQVWVLCTSNGNIYEDSDYGPITESPKLWIALPAWVKG